MLTSLLLSPSCLQTEESRHLALDSLSLDGVSIEDLDLFFVLPGTSIELKKGGKDCQVTMHNLQEYLQVLFACQGLWVVRGVGAEEGDQIRGVGWGGGQYYSY